MRKLRFKTSQGSLNEEIEDEEVNKTKNTILVLISAIKIRQGKVELVAGVGLFSLDFWRRLRTCKRSFWLVVEWVLC